MKVYDVAAHEKRHLIKALEWQAEHNAAHVWLCADERRITFAEASRLTNAYAHGLRRCGVKAGDSVAMVLLPGIEVPLLGLAAVRLGARFTTLSTDYSGEFLLEALEAARAAVLIIDEQICERLTTLETLGPVRHVFVVSDPAKARAVGARPLQDLAAEEATEMLCHAAQWHDVVQIWWSSGTTGKPKGVMHSHSSLLVQGSWSARHRLRDGDVMYSCTPMYLGSPWTGALWPTLVGGVTAAIDRRFSVSRFWDRIRYYGATHCFTLGAMHMLLWKAPPRSDDRDNPLRHAFMIPTPHDLIPQFKSRWGIVEMPQGYGTSETFQIFEAPDDGRAWEKSALGIPTEFYEVRLADEHGDEVPVGEVGEICVRPKHPGVLFSGYFHEPQRTLESWRDLWHHTGDMARKDEQGVYHFADRKQDYIRYKGRNLSMFEVEAVVEKHAAVAECAAYGVESAELESESELAVCVVLKPDQSLEPVVLATFINERAPYYFVPRYIRFADSLPRNAHGRLLKHELRARGLGPDVWDRDRSGFRVVR